MNARNAPLVPAALSLLLASGLAACASAPAREQTGRLHHVGLVWLKEPGNAAQRQQLIDAAHRFAREIPEVRRLSVGRALAQESPMVDDSFDVCLVMELDDQAALDRYAQHPVHEQAAREVFLPFAERILFYDFVGE
jgi:hypothetical protein